MINLATNYDSLFNNAFNYAPHGMALVSLNGRVLNANYSLCQIVGYSEDELKNKAFRALVHKEDVQLFSVYSRQMVTGQIPGFEVEQRFIHKLGFTVWASLSASIVINQQQEPVFSVYQIQNITAQKINESARAEYLEKLQETEKFFNLIIEEIPEAVMIGDYGTIIFINRAGVELLGARSQEEVIGKTIFYFLHPDYRPLVDHQLALLKQGRIVESVNEKLVRFDGEIIDVEIKAIPMIFRNEPAQFIMIRDLTELEKSRELLRNSKKLSIAGELAAGIAHEIRNPLTSLKGFVQIMESGFDSKPEYFNIMYSELSRIELIVNELLLLAKPREKEFQPNDVKELVKQVIALLESQAILHNIEIVTELEEKPVNIFCNENQIKQVIINFIKNAIEAMPDGGKIVIRTEQIGKAIRIDVADQGSGMTEEQLSKLGQPFYTTKENGTGLGLMVSFSIIENHRGSVTVDSKVGQGTVFSIMLPTYTTADY